MPDPTLIVLTGDKGGVGKSTIAVLITEWLLSQDHLVHIIDTDPNQTTQTWVDKCQAKGYQVSTPDAPLTIVDTAGTTGASYTKYVREADIIVVPFQPHVADLETVIGWFLQLRESLQNRVVFVPNRLENTKEQREGVANVRNLLASEGRGALVPGLTNRPAMYPPMLDGRPRNFFAALSDKRVQDETQALFTALFLPYKLEKRD